MKLVIYVCEDKSGKYVNIRDPEDKLDPSQKVLERVTAEPEDVYGELQRLRKKYDFNNI